MKRPLLGMFFILLLAFALRLWRLADHNIWWDEGLAVWAARLPVLQMVDWTAHDVHPPLYFLLLQGWWQLVGDGEFVLRFLSVLLGVLGVALSYRLGHALGGRWVGLLAAFCLALSTFAISWAQELRMYILASTLATGTLWASYRLWCSPRWSGWVAYVLCCAASLWALYISVSVPLVANLAFAFLWLRRGRPLPLLARWLSAQIAVGLLYLPWLLYALPRIPTWSTAEPFSPGFFLQLYSTILAVGLPDNLDAYALPTLATFAVLGLGLFALARTPHSPVKQASFLMLLLGLVLPALVVYVVSLPLPFHLFYAPRLAPRYLLPLATCFYTLLALGIVALARYRSVASLAGAAIVVAVALVGLKDFYPARMRRDDLLSLAATLVAHVQPTDGVILHSDKDWPLFAAHYPGAWHGISNTTLVDPAAAERNLRQRWENTEGLWLATTPDALRIDPQTEIRKWLETQAVAQQHWDFGDNNLTFYARTPARAQTLYDLAPNAPLPTTLNAAGLVGVWQPLTRYPTGDTLHLAFYWAQPPTQTFTLTINGPTPHTLTVTPPAPAQSGLTRQLVALPLPPDWAAGQYQIFRNPTALAHFELIGRNFGQTISLADIPTPLNLQFGPNIRLLGYGLRQTTYHPGQQIALTLYWQAQSPIPERYKVFTHLLGTEWNASLGNFLWGQQDNEPQNGLLPTTTWAPGLILTDDYRLPIAPNAPLGPYQIELGLYGLLDGTRLPITDPSNTPIGDAVILKETITIVAP